MILVCIKAFGNFTPGDEIKVEEGAGFDHYHFEVKREQDHFQFEDEEE